MVPADSDPVHEPDSTIAYEPAPVVGRESATRRVEGAFRYALTIARGPQAGLTFVLGEGVTTAGRSDDNDIFLGDITVSRHHARFTVDDTGLRVEDLGSTNGTYVNRQRCDRSSLAPDDEVIVGKFHLIVVEGDV